MGRPAVPIVSGRFEGGAIASSRAFGMPTLRLVIVPRIYRNLSPEESLRNTEPAFDDLVPTLTVDADGDAHGDGAEAAEVKRFEGEDRLDAVLRMNEDYLSRDLGDGFPLLPATRSAVDELLKGTGLPPEHVVCDMPPGFGIATVEKIAINAAAAGAKPGAHARDIRGCEGAFADWRSRREVSTHVHESASSTSGSKRAYGQGAGPQCQVGPRAGVLDVSEEHRSLVSEQDGHGYDRDHP